MQDEWILIENPIVEFARILCLLTFVCRYILRVRIIKMFEWPIESFTNIRRVWTLSMKRDGLVYSSNRIFADALNQFVISIRLEPARTSAIVGLFHGRGRRVPSICDHAGQGGRIMQHASIKAAVGGLMLVFMAGCASGTALTRAQNPDGYGVQPRGQAIQQVRYNDSQYYDAMQMDPAAQAANCYPDTFGHQFCAPPTSSKFKYVVPQGLSYPDPNAMPGMVQYPYYTVKGPDCFFHQ